MEQGKRIMVPSGLGIHAAKLIELLTTTDKEFLSDGELEGCCGRSCAVAGDGYGNLQTAIRRAIRDPWGREWKRLPGTGGITLLKGRESVDRGRSDRRKFHRAARETTIRLMAIDNGVLEDSQRTEHLTLLATMGTISLLSSTNAAKRLAAQRVSNPLDLPKLLEAWKANGKQPDQAANS